MIKFLILLIAFSITLPVAFAQEYPVLGVKIETIAENLKVPWEIDFASDGRIFVTERVGNLRIIENGVLSEPVLTLDVSGTEGGLLGLTLDPNFDENHFIYLYYSYNEPGEVFNRIVRYTEQDNQFTDEKILLDKIPGSQWHDGGRLKFGPDGLLYAATGDAANYNLSQDLSSLAGKILRINPDGSIPDDNPFGSEIYSLGHRNPQGIDWHPESNILVATEHGPSGELGRAHDEVNVIYSGKNYGWPEIIGDDTKQGLENPIVHTGFDTWAPSGAAFYDSNQIADWYGKYFVATLRGEHLRMLDLDLENNQVIESTALFSGEFGRLRNVIMGPDGHLYFMTSNQDGRGDPVVNDDRIFRILPLEPPVMGDSSMTPLKQVVSGVLPENVSCKDKFELVFKATNQMPACVKESSVQKLRQIGWAQ